MVRSRWSESLRSKHASAAKDQSNPRRTLVAPFENPKTGGGHLSDKKYEIVDEALKSPRNRFTQRCFSRFSNRARRNSKTNQNSNYLINVMLRFASSTRRLQTILLGTVASVLFSQQSEAQVIYS
jgi:hypothetical protein